MIWLFQSGAPISDKRLEKELNRIAVEFELKCRNGEVSSEQDMKLAQFCPLYLDLVSDSLAPRTKEQYADYIRRQDIKKYLAFRLGLR